MNSGRSDRLARYLEYLRQYPAFRAAADVWLKLVLDTAAIAEFEHITGKVIRVFAENQYFLMLHDLIENTAGDRFVYLRILNKRHLRGGRGVIVLPVEPHTDSHRVVILIRIFRHALRT